MLRRYRHLIRISGYGTILVAALGAFPAKAEAQTPSGGKLPMVAVMPLQPKGVSGIDADVITDAIATQLQQSGMVRVMERAQMDQILKEQGFQQSGACDGADCAVQMGKLLSVDRILVGTVGLVGRTYTLNLRLVAVGTGEVLRSDMKSHPGTIDDVLTSLVPETVSDLVGSPAPVRTASDTATPPVAPAKPASASVSKSHWGWWVVGTTVVVAGGVAAAILLMKGSPSPSSNPGTTGPVPVL
ncbi:MAG TPA: CsgG/HfaB family protein [Fibrobacteria bacterium]|nr:CsgG/HfaB family protein [Fibrobacteria bacterium]